MKNLLLRSGVGARGGMEPSFFGELRFSFFGESFFGELRFSLTTLISKGYSAFQITSACSVIWSPLSLASFLA